MGFGAPSIRWCGGDGRARRGFVEGGPWCAPVGDATMNIMPKLPPYVVDPDDPRAPPQDVWDEMSADERARVVDSLPSEFELSEAHPPEGDLHFEAKVRAREVLGGFFSRIGRRVYLG